MLFMCLSTREKNLGGWGWEGDADIPIPVSAWGFSANVFKQLNLKCSICSTVSKANCFHWRHINNCKLFNRLTWPGTLLLVFVSFWSEYTSWHSWFNQIYQFSLVKMSKLSKYIDLSFSEKKKSWINWKSNYLLFWSLFIVRIKSMQRKHDREILIF